MTLNEFYNIWKKNINSEYIIPDIDSLLEDNLIISKEIFKEHENYEEIIIINGVNYKIRITKGIN